MKQAKIEEKQEKIAKNIEKGQKITLKIKKTKNGKKIKNSQKLRKKMPQIAKENDKNLPEY